jgi:hypothetical protein
VTPRVDGVVVGVEVPGADPVVVVRGRQRRSTRPSDLVVACWFEVEAASATQSGVRPDTCVCLPTYVAVHALCSTPPLLTRHCLGSGSSSPLMRFGSLLHRDRGAYTS